jgi:Trypsin-like peptidase domain
MVRRTIGLPGISCGSRPGRSRTLCRPRRAWHTTVFLFGIGGAEEWGQHCDGSMAGSIVKNMSRVHLPSGGGQFASLGSGPLGASETKTCHYWRDAMISLPWHEVVEIVKPHVVKILTPRGSGTGFLLFNSKSRGFCAVATAAHVVNAAHYWEEPIRLQHSDTGSTTLVRAGKRAVLANVENDVAAVVFQRQNFALPDEGLPLGPSDMYVKVGVEVGWLGFPAISNNLCFFSGRISTYDEGAQRYLVDGVAINGVSGGPAFKPENGSVSMMGVLSA